MAKADQPPQEHDDKLKGTGTGTGVATNVVSAVDFVMTTPSGVVSVETKAFTKSWPQPDPFIVEGIKDYLIRRQKMSRPPWQSAKLLAFIIELHRSRLPFPERKAVSAHLGISVPAIDATINTRTAEGYLGQEYKWTDGNVKHRASSVRERFLIPSDDLLELYKILYGKLNGKLPEKLSEGAK